MLNVGGGELLVIMLIALIVLGPQRLPDAAKQVGRVVGDLRRISSGFQQELKDALETDDAPTPLRRKESAPLAATVAEADDRPAPSPRRATTGATTGADAAAAAPGDGGAAPVDAASDGTTPGRATSGAARDDQTTVAPAVAAALDEVVAALDPPPADEPTTGERSRAADPAPDPGRADGATGGAALGDERAAS
jgi:sec-independent protein translocase protein TatB